MDIAQWAKAIGLEGELGAKPERRRRLDQQRRSPEGIDHWRQRRHAAINRPSLIQRHSALAIEDVEPIATDAQFPLLSQLDRVIGAQIKVHCRRRTVGPDAVDDVRESRLSGRDRWNNGRAALHLEPFLVSAERVRFELVERRAGLHVEVSANEKLKLSPVATVELELMRTIVRHTSIGVIEQALKVEQRSDVRIRLPVVVAEQAFVVTNQA